MDYNVMNAGECMPVETAKGILESIDKLLNETETELNMISESFYGYHSTEKDIKDIDVSRNSDTCMLDTLRRLRTVSERIFGKTEDLKARIW